MLDISMPELNGIVLSRRLCRRDAGYPFADSRYEDRAYLNQALEAACAAMFSNAPR